jgi:hypothetical protein
MLKNVKAKDDSSDRRKPKTMDMITLTKLAE